MLRFIEGVGRNVIPFGATHGQRLLFATVLDSNEAAFADVNLADESKDRLVRLTIADVQGHAHSMVLASGPNTVATAWLEAEADGSNALRNQRLRVAIRDPESFAIVAELQPETDILDGLSAYGVGAVYCHDRYVVFWHGIDETFDALSLSEDGQVLRKEEHASPRGSNFRPRGVCTDDGIAIVLSGGVATASCAP